MIGVCGAEVVDGVIDISLIAVESEGVEGPVTTTLVDASSSNPESSTAGWHRSSGTSKIQNAG
jgi:hypothetical protein